MKKVFLSILLSVCFILGNGLVPALADDLYDSNAVFKIMDTVELNQLKAKGAILIDGTTGTVFFEKNTHEKLPIASMTKIMTMLLVMEAVDQGKIKWDDKVIISEHSYDMGGSEVWLKPGEVFTVRELMEAVAIHSANDAAVALSEFISGSENVFVAAMNEKAKLLGMRDTRFLDCTGLTDEGHYSSAFDVALMSRELLTKHPTVTEFTKIWHKMFREKDPKHTVALDNTNRLIHYYSGAIGLKTGFTTKAGHCLTAAAIRNGQLMLSVVIGEPDSNTRWAESRKLLDYGYANFETVLVNKKGEEVESVPIAKGLKSKVKGVFDQDIYLVLKKGEQNKIERKVKIQDNLVAPLEKGQKIGDMTYWMNGKEVGKAEIKADAHVEKASFIRLFFRMVASWFGVGKG